MPEFYMILAKKLSKYRNFFMIFVRKIYKIPEFYIIFARKMPEFYIIIGRKIFSRFLGGRVPPLPPSPTPMIIGVHSRGDPTETNERVNE